jgi:hypothetical protein
MRQRTFMRRLSRSLTAPGDACLMASSELADRDASLCARCAKFGTLISLAAQVRHLLRDEQEEK